MLSRKGHGFNAARSPFRHFRKSCLQSLTLASHFYYMSNVTPHPEVAGKHQRQLADCISFILLHVHCQSYKMYLAESHE